MATLTVCTGPKDFKVVPHAEWTQSRVKFLEKEKEFTKLRDELARLRRELPWEKVEKSYVFDGPDGKETLADLFAGQPQLIVQHLMFGPDDKMACKSCSFWADSMDANEIHLRHRNTQFVAISRAPLAKIEDYRKRMGWRFKWLSAFANEFNFDYGVSFTPEQLKNGAVYNYRHGKVGNAELPGFSVFVKDAKDEIFHSYSTYTRGLDALNPTYQVLDLTPMGRDEETQKPHEMAWVRRHDEYENATPAAAASCCNGKQ